MWLVALYKCYMPLPFWRVAASPQLRNMYRAESSRRHGSSGPHVPVLPAWQSAVARSEGGHAQGAIPEDRRDEAQHFGRGALRCLSLYAQPYHCHSLWVKPKFHLARHVSTRHVRRVDRVHFGCVELVEQHGSTRARLARHVERVVSCRRGVTRRATWNLGLNEWVSKFIKTRL